MTALLQIEEQIFWLFRQVFLMYPSNNLNIIVISPFSPSDCLISERSLLLSPVTSCDWVRSARSLLLSPVPSCDWLISLRSLLLPTVSPCDFGNIFTVDVTVTCFS